MDTRRAPKSAGNERNTERRAPQVFRPREERLAAGEALRDIIPRRMHADWAPAAGRRDPIDILEESNRDRVPELIPIRYGRMLRSPFTFLRGSAALMASDLATTPSTGLQVQACGDAHLLNFGLFATPERNLVFDLNDFDETLPAPWEWDLKRLAVSFAVAARDNQLSDRVGRKAAVECVAAYREHLRQCSRMSPLEVWYARLDAETLIAQAPDEDTRELRKKYADKARARVIDHLFPTIAVDVGGRTGWSMNHPSSFMCLIRTQRNGCARAWWNTASRCRTSVACCSTATASRTSPRRWSASAASEPGA